VLKKKYVCDIYFGKITYFNRDPIAYYELKAKSKKEAEKIAMSRFLKEVKREVKIRVS